MRILFVLVSISIVLPCSGCHLYRVGADTLYAPDVSTIYVPIFESDSYDTDLAERLTEATIKEIQLNTPYRVIATADADSILTGKIVHDSRRVLVEDFFDNPRELQTDIRLNVRWLNRRRIPIRETNVAMPAALVGIGRSATLIPEAGESWEVAKQEAIERLAEQIVATMEQPW